MDRKLFEQAADLRREIREEQDRIVKLEKKLDNVLERPEQTEPMQSVCSKRLQSKRKLVSELEEQLMTVEEYIRCIANSRTRRIAKMYFIDGLTQQQIANRLNDEPSGQWVTADAIRKRIDRAFDGYKKDKKVS